MQRDQLTRGFKPLLKQRAREAPLNRIKHPPVDTNRAYAILCLKVCAAFSIHNVICITLAAVVPCGFHKSHTVLHP